MPATKTKSHGRTREEMNEIGKKTRFSSKKAAEAGRKGGRAKQEKIQRLGGLKSVKEIYATFLADDSPVDPGLTVAQSIVFTQIKKAMEGDPTAYKVCAEHLSLILRESARRRRDAILTKLKKGKISLLEAALDLAQNESIPLEDVINRLLAKQPPEPEDPSNGVYCSISEDESFKLAQERLQKRKEQKDGLPVIRKQMEELHKQSADSFAF